jgi:hypothetical protein
MKVRLVTILSAITIIFFTGCNSGEEVQKKVGTVFYFYPESNTYLDRDNGLYYVLNKEQGWQETKQLTTEQQTTLGTRVLLDHPQKPLWKNNEQDRLLYSVALHTSPQDYQKKLYQDSINSLPKKEPVKEEKDIEEKEKTGFGKFLQKVFSKKEKKDKENKL